MKLELMPVQLPSNSSGCPRNLTFSLCDTSPCSVYPPNLEKTFTPEPCCLFNVWLHQLYTDARWLAVTATSSSKLQEEGEEEEVVLLAPSTVTNM